MKYGKKYFSRYQPFFDAMESAPDDADIIVIGANDGVTADPLYRVWRDSWRGFFIEPNPDAQERIRVNREGVVIPCAISDEEGFLTLYAMTTDAAAGYVEAVVADGSTITSANRQYIVDSILTRWPQGVTKFSGIDRMTREIQVPSRRLDSVVSEYGIRPYAIQIDVEGMETVVVPQALSVGASVVMWEHIHIDAPDELEDLARSIGYQMVKMRQDTMAYEML